MDFDAVAQGRGVSFDGESGDKVFDALSRCHQSTRFHGEGHVARHTEMVVDAANEALEHTTLNDAQAEVVRLSALLHDIGKPAVTVEVTPCEWSAPRHAEVGAGMVNELFDSRAQLRRRGIGARAQVAALVRAHMWAWHPEQVSPGAAIRLTHLGDLRQLFSLWAADGNGRIAEDQERLVEQVEWAAALIVDHTGGATTDAYPLIDQVCDPSQLDPRVRRSVLRAVVHGQITSVGAAAAHIAAAERQTGGPTILWTSGLPGAGKSTWVRRWADEHDAEILTVTGARRRDRDMSRGRNRHAVADAVRSGRNVVVDATHVTRESRDRLCGLADIHGAHLEAVAFTTPAATCVRRQRSRPVGTAVPEDAIYSMLHAWRWPTPDEYDTLTVVDGSAETVWTPESRDAHIAQGASR